MKGVSLWSLLKSVEDEEVDEDSPALSDFLPMGVDSEQLSHSPLTWVL